MGAGGVELIEVGRIGKPHGLGGEVTVMSSTDLPERYSPGSELLWESDAGVATLVVEGSRPHQGKLLVKFVGVADRNGAETLRGIILLAQPRESGPEGRMWVGDLVGAQVYDMGGANIGTVSAVQANPAHDLLELTDGTLIPTPFIVEFLAGRITVNLPEGLIEVNRREQ